MEWQPNGDQISLSDMQAQAATGANVVRIAVNQNFWLVGANGYSASYRTNIANAIAWAKQAGMDVIIDLHWSNKGNLGTAGAQQLMADTYSIQFWTEFANAYKNDPAVLFELYNEPHDVPCSVWKDGGSGSWGFQAAGMQQMYNAVRATGANNLILVNGLNWGNDLTCVRQGFAITNAQNLIYCAHTYFVYDGTMFPADWDNRFGYLAPNYPLLISEFGNFDCSTAKYVDYLNYLDQRQMHFTAWAWYPGGCNFPGLITGWNNLPSAQLTGPGQLVVQKFNTIGAVGNQPPPVVTSQAATTQTPTTQAPTTQAATQPAAGGSSCTGTNVYNNGLSAGWVNFPWASSLTLNAAAPGGDPAITSSMLWTTPDVNGGGLEFRTYSCPQMGNFQAFRMRVFPSSGSWSFTLKAHNCGFASVCSSDYVTLTNVAGGAWTTLTLPVRSACLDALGGLSGFEINYRWTGTSGNPTVNIGNVQLVTSCTGAGGGTTQPATQTPTTTQPATQTPTTTQALPPVAGGGSRCTAPVWSASGNDAGWSVNGYYLHNNIWNAGAAGQGPQTTYGCSEKSWYTISTQNNVGDGSVKTYPNIHLDLPNAFTTGVPFNNYGSIWSTFAGAGPKTGIYNVAYDLWLNGVGWGNGHTEYMIWTENQGQTPLGTFDSTVTISGYSWKAYHYNDGNANVVSLVAPTPIAAGVLDLKAFIQWGINKGWIPPNPSLNQFGFGVEIVSTNNQPLRFDFTDFSVQLSAGVVSPPTQTTTQPTTASQTTTVSQTTTQVPPSGSGGSCTGTTLYSTGLSVAAGWQTFFWGGSLALGVAPPVANSITPITSSMKLTSSSQWGGSLIFRTYQCPTMNGKRAFRAWLLPTGGGTWTFSFKPRTCSLAADYGVVCAANAVTVSLPGNSVWTAVELPVHSACLDALGGLSGFSIDFSNSGSAASSSTFISDVKLVDSTCPVLRAAAADTASSSSSSSRSGLPVAAIVAIVAGCVVLAAVVVGVVLIRRRRRSTSLDPTNLLHDYHAM